MDGCDGEWRLALPSAEMRHFLAMEPVGVTGGWLWKPRKTAPPHPGGWLRFYLAVLLKLLLLQPAFRTILR